ncbi:MAG: hypothetical protein ACK5MR_13005 [Cumulibacter sp.]
MNEDEVGPLAEELKLLALAIRAQDPNAPGSVLRTVGEYLGGTDHAARAEPDIQRIEFS